MHIIDFESGQLDSRDDKSIMSRFLNFISINEDIVGWITVPGTVIDYPVVKTTNNEFYLKNNIYKSPSKAGAVFMDFRNSGLSQEYNTILYGHNMKDGSIFAGLSKYKDEEFFLDNSIIEFHSIYEEMRWEIFAVYVTDISFNYLQTDFSSDIEYLDFVQMLKGKSMYETNIDITDVDEILTLSTCSYEFKNARLVIHARKVLQ